jgi:hypothetical protein
MCPMSTDLCGVGCGTDVDICAAAPVCPPQVAAVPGATAPVGASPLYVTLADVTCDYGDQISQLARLTCAEESPECSLGESIVAQANAYVMGALTKCYQWPLVEDATGAALFPDVVVPGDLTPGSLAFIVYWQYRRWVGVLARWYLFRDGRDMEQRKPAPLLMLEKQATQFETDLDGCKACGCTLLPGLRKVGRTGSVLAVAGRPASPLQYPNRPMTEEAARLRAGWGVYRG